MSQQRKHDIRAISRHFQMPGDYVSHAPCGHGLINDTYEIRYSQAGTSVRYIMQRINHDIFRKPEQVMENIARVTGHIRNKLRADGGRDTYRRVLVLVSLRESPLLYHRDDEGNYWRAYYYIEGAEAHNHVNSTALAEEAARTFGRFQSQLADLPDPSSLHHTIPDFHNTASRYHAFEKAVEKDAAGRGGNVAREIDWVRARKDNTSRLTDLLAAGLLRERVTHNDTKINNVMLDYQSGEGLCVMDLDTVMPGLIHYDFGDLVRTTTISTAEDERDTERVQMRMPMFEALTRGFLSTARSFLTDEEIKHLAFSGNLITLETGIRFLTDYLNGDTYFKTTREGHNLDRFRVQQRMVESIERQSGQMEEAVQASLKEIDQGGAG